MTSSYSVLEFSDAPYPHNLKHPLSRSSPVVLLTDKSWIDQIKLIVLLSNCLSEKENAENIVVIDIDLNFCYITKVFFYLGKSCYIAKLICVLGGLVFPL